MSESVTLDNIIENAVNIVLKTPKWIKFIAKEKIKRQPFFGPYDMTKSLREMEMKWMTTAK